MLIKWEDGETVKSRYKLRLMKEIKEWLRIQTCSLLIASACWSHGEQDVWTKKQLKMKIGMVFC